MELRKLSLRPLKQETSEKHWIWDMISANGTTTISTTNKEGEIKNGK